MIIIEKATQSDLPAIRQWLQANELCEEDIGNAPLQLYKGIMDGNWITVGDIERYGSCGLLRSIVVKDHQRSKGVGREFTQKLMEKASEEGIRELFLLTTTADGFFIRLGFEKTERESATEALQQSYEFRQFCPSTAVCMKKKL